jgi:hypothetical protein
VRDAEGKIVGEKQAPTYRVTVDAIGTLGGRDRRRRLVVGLEAGDVISFRPEGTRQKITAKALNLYIEVLHWRANAAQLERARARKAVKQAQRVRRAIQRADRKLSRPLAD